MRNGKPEKFKGYCNDVWFDQAIRFIRANKDREFFCYLPTNIPHKPLLVPEKCVAPFVGKLPESIARFHGMLVNFDENLARLRNELRQLELEENTVLIFLGDKGKDYAVMTDRWRLVNGRELHEIKSDPGQRRNVADQHPQVVADLRKAYDHWWNDISTEFARPARIIIGSDRANPTALNPHDWIGRPLFDQSQVRRGRVGREGLEYQGHWMIEVAQDGRYEIEFRRWPRELNRPITAAIEGGAALPPTQARLKIGDLEQSLLVTADMVGVTFSVDLKAGPAILEGRFIDEKSGKWRSPFYVYVKRIGVI